MEFETGFSDPGLTLDFQPLANTPSWENQNLTIK